MLRILMLYILLVVQSGNHTDALPLLQAGRSVTPHVPPDLMWAVAFVETNHSLDPSITAHECVDLSNW